MTTMPGCSKTHFLLLIRLVGIVLFLLCGNTFYGQISKLDSLQTAITQAKTDTSRILLNIELAIEYLKTNPDSALQLIEKVYPVVEESGDQKLLAKVLLICSC